MYAITRRSRALALVGVLLALSACGNDKDEGGDDTNVASDVTDDGGATDATTGTDVETGDTQGGGSDAGATDAGGATDGGGSDSAGGTDAGPGDAGGKPDIDETKGLASPELLVKILGPSGRDWNQSESQKIQLSGVLFGQADKLTWSSSNGKSGNIDVAAYWISPIIDLEEGDNTLTVTATAGGKTLTDNLHIVYNPFFSFESAPEVGPDLHFVNESSTLIVRMPMAAAGTGAAGKGPVNPSSIKIVEVDADGKQLKDHGSLVDTGSASKCDDIQKDGMFSTCFSFTPNVAKRMYFRVLAEVDVFNKKYTAKSPVAVVDVVNRFTASECNAIVGLQKKVKDAYIAAVKGGTDTATAQGDAVAAFKADATVADAGRATDGYGVWVAYKSGRVGALNLAPDGTRGGGGTPAPGTLSTAALPTYSVGTRRALALAPYAKEFGADDEAAAAGVSLKERQCPPFAVDAYNDSAALLQSYRDMSTYGVVAISGHGDAYFDSLDPKAKQALGWEHMGSQEVIWSGERVQCSSLLQSKKTCNKNGVGCGPTQKCVKTSANAGVCVDHTQGDIMTGRVVIGADTYGLTPAFLQRHNTTDFPNSIVYLGACRTMWNGSLAVQLYGLGAAAVVGYSGYVTNQFAATTGKEFFEQLVAKSGSVLQAVNVKDTDPVYKSWMRMLGNSKANAKDSNLINPSFDLGKPTGWKKVGDGRVISRLGVTVPVAGKFMGIISTGLGFTTQTGSLEQPFCVPKGSKQMCFYWKFYSEEFIEFCGSSYMDRFTAQVAGEKGKITLTDVWIDPLCPYDCGGKKPCTPGSASCKCGKQWKTLTPSDVSFDKGDVHMTPWQKECKDVGAFEGQRVNLTFFCTDVGDSIYDSAILLDEVTIQ